MNEKIKVIIDNVGRYVIGSLVGEDAETLTLKTPVILHVQPNPQNGQLQVQTIPLLFNEFIGDKNTNVWTFSKKSIAISEATLDERLVSQYNAIANPSPIIQPQTEVIKLFDD